MGLAWTVFTKSVGLTLQWIAGTVPSTVPQTHRGEELRNARKRAHVTVEESGTYRIDRVPSAQEGKECNVKIVPFWNARGGSAE